MFPVKLCTLTCNYTTTTFTAPPVIQQSYKCVKPILPQADNAIFYEVRNGQKRKLQFVHIKKDPDFFLDETGGAEPALGDSGNPYWVLRKRSTRMVDYRDQRFTIISVHGGNLGTFANPHGAYVKNKLWACRGYATKITPEISEWIMDWHDSMDG